MKNDDMTLSELIEDIAEQYGLKQIKLYMFAKKRFKDEATFIERLQRTSLGITDVQIVNVSSITTGNVTTDFIYVILTVNYTTTYSLAILIETMLNTVWKAYYDESIQYFLLRKMSEYKDELMTSYYDINAKTFYLKSSHFYS